MRRPLESTRKGECDIHSEEIAGIGVADKGVGGGRNFISDGDG